MPQNKKPVRQTWAAVILVVVIVVAVMWTANAIVSHNRVQNCVDSGRHDCVPVTDGSGG